MEKYMDLKRIFFLLGTGLSILTLFLPATLSADPKTGSAGFLDEGGHMRVIRDTPDQPDNGPLSLPLKRTRVEAHIAGMVTTVKVIQEFGNPYDTPIEAIYVFPLPQQAAVNAMKMTIGERIIEGKIKPREEARKLYKQAKNQGRTASLLDQERPNIFTQSVANILPGDDIQVELSYFHDLVFEKGQYEFVFPMVAGPRYIPGRLAGQTGQGWSPDTGRVTDGSKISPPLLPPGVRSGHDIQLCVDLDAGVPYRDLETPSHAIEVTRKSASRVLIRLSPQDRIPNKDFILRWKAKQKGPAAGWLAHKEDTEGHFFLMLQPDVRLPKAQTAPREYVFVIDTSGSMHGFPLDQCKRIVKRCLDDLRPVDNFQVILFAGGASSLAPAPLPATAGNIRKALEYVMNARGGGGTEFLPALEKALKGPDDPERSRIVLFLSDGYIGYETQVLKYMHQHRGQANIFPLGVGSSVNRYLIDGMARVGQGEPFYLTPDESPDPVVERFFKYVSRPSLTNIEVRFNGLEVTDIEPPVLPDLFADRPLSIVGKYSQGGRGQVVVTGYLAGRPWKQTLQVKLPDHEPSHPGLAGLWARRSIEALSDQQAIGNLSEDKAKVEITALALKYHLMSAYTSFVAIDSQVRNIEGTSQTMPIPVPLPDQVSQLAAPSHAYMRSGPGKGYLGRAMSGLKCRKALAPMAAAPVREMELKEEAADMSSTDGLRDKAAARNGTTSAEKNEGRSMTIDTLKIRGTLPEAAVRQVLEKALKKWQKEKCLADLKGSLRISIEVQSSGKVIKAWIKDPASHPKTAVSCLLKKMKKLSFSASGSKTTIHVTFRM